MRCSSSPRLFVEPAAFVAWGWRVPFLASAVLVGVGLFVRVGLTESPAFAEVARRHDPPRPVVDVLRSSARTVLLAAGSYIGISALGYIGARLLRVVRDARAGAVAAATVLAPLSCGDAVRRVGRRVRAMVGPHRPAPDHAVGQRARSCVWAAVFFPLLDMRRFH